MNAPSLTILGSALLLVTGITPSPDPAEPAARHPAGDGGVAAGAVAATDGATGTVARVDANAQSFPFHTPFDFKDSHYRRNGLDPRRFETRITPDSPNATHGRSVDPRRNNTRILEVNGGYDAVGSLLYYPAPPAFFPAEAFRDNERGRHAREIANQFRAFIFPKRDGNPLSPAPPNRRQDNVFDTSSGYLTVNPLGLWRITFPRFTDAALNTGPGQEKLEELRQRNGTDLDGTPIIKRLSEINELDALGYLELRQRPEDGSAGGPWVV